MEISKIKDELISQKTNQDKGNIYHYSQVSFAYNSNRIEGSRLTSEQTAAIFETATFIPKSDEVVKVDDLIETSNHFRLFDYMLDHIDDKLDKEMLINMHKVLKRNTSDEREPNYNVEGFKIVDNVIGEIFSIETTPAELVESEIESLLKEYNSKDNISIEDIIDFHVKFELIHPFDDGNGRVGRMIMFKECLKNNIMPFVILFDKVSFYKRGLKEYKNDKMYLTDTIGDAQDDYEKICNDLLEIKSEVEWF